MLKKGLEELRLQKFLAHAGVASRRKSEELITSGRVKVNGKIITRLGTKIDPERDRVLVDEYEVTSTEDKVYYIINKPPGYVTTTNDEMDRPTVFDFFDCDKRIYPVGRLDKDTRGLLLLTNDGIIVYRLTHPSFEVPKTYEAWVKGKMKNSTLKKLTAGIKLEDGFSKPKNIEKLAIKGNKTLIKITLIEGRKRQVRRMLKNIGHPVDDLVRIKFANLHLGELPQGQYRKLTKNELYNLKKMIDLD